MAFKYVTTVRATEFPPYWAAEDDRARCTSRSFSTGGHGGGVEITKRGAKSRGKKERVDRGQEKSKSKRLVVRRNYSAVPYGAEIPYCRPMALLKTILAFECRALKKLLYAPVATAPRAPGRP